VIRLCAILLALMPVAARADTVVPPQAFEQFSTGKTLYFFRGGAFFGAEQYFPDRQSLWQYNGGDCLQGHWFARGDLVCFTYQDDPRVQCWHFLEKSSGYAARADGDPPELDLELGRVDTKPLDCTGPGFGS
jgi:hypothetical protein